MNLKSTETMDPKKELELLEFLDGIPETPDFAPMPTVRKEHPFIKIPYTIQEFFNKVEYKPKVEKDGTMHIDDYMEALTEFGIKFYGPLIISRASTEEIKDKK